MTNHPPAPVEPPEELARLREDLIDFYQPVNSQERIAVERIALAQQSILRASRLETSLFTGPGADQALHSILETEAFKNFLRYQAQAERTYRRAVEEFDQLQGQRPPLWDPAPDAATAPAETPAPHSTLHLAATGNPPSVPSLARSAVPASPSFAAPLLASSRNSGENPALRL